MEQLLNVRAIGWGRLKTEMSGGLASAIVGLPQNMSIGVVAFAPLGVEYLSQALIAGIIGGISLSFISALFGGTQGAMSAGRISGALVFAAVLAGLLASDDFYAGHSFRNEIALFYTFSVVALAGVLQLFTGLFRVGDIIKFMPYSVVAGIINAATLLVLTHQIVLLFGLPIGFDSGEVIGALSLNTLTRIGFLILSIGCIWSASKFLPNTMRFLVGGTAAALIYSVMKNYGADLDLGETSPHLENLQLAAHLNAADLVAITNAIEFDSIGRVLPLLLFGAFSIAILQSLESLFTIASYDELSDQRSQASKELSVQGIATILCSVFGVISGSVSYIGSSASFNAGGRTSWAVLFSSLFMGIGLLIVVPFMHLIPNLVVSAVIIMISIQMLDRWTVGLVNRLEWRDFLHKDRIPFDFLIIVAVITTAVVFGIIVSVFVGVILAFLEFIFHMSNSPIRRSLRANSAGLHLIRGDGSSGFLQKHGDAIATLELEGAFFFGSTGSIEQEIERLEKEGVRYFILDFKRIRNIDSTGSRALNRIFRRFEKTGKILCLSYVQQERRSSQSMAIKKDRRRNSQARQTWFKLKQYGVIDQIGDAAIFEDTDSALRYCEGHLYASLLKNEGTKIERRSLFTTLFLGMQRTDIRQIWTYVEKCKFSMNEAVFQQEDDGESAYFLASGAVDVYINIKASGRRMRVISLSEGAVFGEMALLDPMPRSATVVAVKDTVCYKMTSENFEKLTALNPHLGFTLMKSMCLIFTNRLRIANRALVELES